MDLVQIKYFLGVANELHFSRASEKLFIAQSALSRQIKQLEAEIGVLLFERDKRNVKLTPAGIFYKTEWERLLKEIQNINRHTKQIHQGEEGELRIGHPGSAIYSILPKSLSLLRQNFPNINAELSEINEQDLIEALLNYEIDVGFSRQITENLLLETKKLFSENFSLVLPKNHQICEENFTDLGIMKYENFIIPSLRGNSKYCQILHGIFNFYNFEPKVIYESDFGATIMRLVEQNLGVSIMPISYKNSASANLRFIELPFQSDLYLIYRRNDENPILKNYINVCDLVENHYF